MAVDIKALLDELEERIEKLKVRYDQYFMGIERFEPIKERREVDRMVRHLRGQVISNTALKFKFHMLLQKLTTYKQYWDRVQRQIEEGTYRRDLLRIQRRLKERGIDAPELLKARTASEVEGVLSRYATKGPAANRVQPASRSTASVSAKTSPSRRSGPPPIPPEALGLPEEKLRRIHEAFIQARRQVGQSTKGLTFEKFVQSIAKQLPKIQKQSGASQIEFAVEIKNGKASLKAIPKGSR